MLVVPKSRLYPEVVFTSLVDKNIEETDNAAYVTPPTFLNNLCDNLDYADIGIGKNSHPYLHTFEKGGITVKARSSLLYRQMEKTIPIPMRKDYYLIISCILSLWSGYYGTARHHSSTEGINAMLHVAFPQDMRFELAYVTYDRKFPQKLKERIFPINRTCLVIYKDNEKDGNHYLDFIGVGFFGDLFSLNTEKVLMLEDTDTILQSADFRHCRKNFLFRGRRGYL